jgi:sensor histidine kinase regulating citrate/malate metabolism
VGGDQAQQGAGVAGLAHHLEARALQQAGQPLAQQQVVLGQHHPQPIHHHAPDYGPARCCEHAADIGAPGRRRRREPRGGSGLVGLADRVEALGGTIQVHSPAGQETRLRIDLPIQDRPSS